MAFVATVTIVALIFVWFMPKRLSKKEIYITWGVLSVIAVFMDLLLGISPLDLYDFTKNPKPEWSSIVIEMIMPACFGVIFLNFMPMKKRNFVIYMVGYVLLSVCIEWGSVRSGYLIYKGWKLWYSVFVYVIGTLFLRWHIFFIRKSDK